MWAALGEIGRSLAGDVRVVVVRGSGRAFSAGVDRALLDAGRTRGESGRRERSPAGPGPGELGPGEPDLGDLGPGDLGPGELASLPADRAESLLASWQQAFGWLRRPDLVSVAAVQGPAVGAGFQLALACDLRVLSEDARLRMAEPSLGLVPDLGGTKPLVDLVGCSRALEICATGRWVGAAEADRIGLATIVVPGDQLAAATSDLVAALLATPRNALVETKALLAAAGRRGQAEQEAAERAAQLRLLRERAGFADG
jgi:enoyl-CoA hydratase/carnithine racemase